MPRFRSLHALVASSVALVCTAAVVFAAPGVGVVTNATPADLALVAVHDDHAQSRGASRADLVQGRDASRTDLASDPDLDLAQSRQAALDAQASAIAAEELRVLEQQRAEEEARIAAEAAATEFLAKNGYLQDTTAPKEIGRQMALNLFGWGADQFTCFDKIIMNESKWDPFADNPHSSAYGIPQALPGKKMASEGADWETNPATQIRWGLKYVKGVYGTPCKAWSFKSAHGWY